VPGAQPAAADTSMHTDAYDPEELALWVTNDDEDVAEPARDDETEAAPSAAAGGSASHDDVSTAPIDITARTQRADHPSGDQPAGTDHTDAQVDAERASDAAMRRWLSE